MITGSEVFKKLKEIKPYLSREYSVKEIGIFGSFSDDTFGDDSDIDLLVEFEKPIGWKFFSLEIYLEKLFERKIDLVTRNAIKNQMKESVLGKVKYI